MHKNVERVIKYIWEKWQQQPKSNKRVKLKLLDFAPNNDFSLDGLENFGWITPVGTVSGNNDAEEMVLNILMKLKEDGIIEDYYRDPYKNQIKSCSALVPEGFDNYFNNSFGKSNKLTVNTELEKEDPRIITTLYKMICGLTKRHYKDKVSRITTMQTVILNEAGIDIDKKTLKTHIDKALEEDQNQES